MRVGSMFMSSVLGGSSRISLSFSRLFLCVVWFFWFWIWDLSDFHSWLPRDDIFLTFYLYALAGSSLLNFRCGGWRSPSACCVCLQIINCGLHSGPLLVIRYFFVISLRTFLFSLARWCGAFGWCFFVFLRLYCEDKIGEGGEFRFGDVWLCRVYRGAHVCIFRWSVFVGGYLNFISILIFYFSHQLYILIPSLFF